MDCLAQGKKSTWRVPPVSDFELSADTLLENWKNIPWLPIPQRDTSALRKITKAKLAYSPSGIYGMFYCEDHQITTTLLEDFTDLYNEDVVEIFFWTDERHPFYFEYELSPLNYELPILVPNIDDKFFGWRPWHYEGDRLTRHAAQILRRGDQVTGWVATFFIPYALLKPLGNLPPTKGTRWRANLYRIDYDRGASEWSWQRVGPSFHEYKRFGTLIFD